MSNAGKIKVLSKPQPKAGLRERNKADKLRRIQGAARELFVEKGYDNTTTREIAQRADVGLGTLFAYAADKRDLLFLIFNSEIEKVFEKGRRDALKKDSLLDQFLAFFRSYYQFFMQQPALSRFMLRELTFYMKGTEAQRFQAGRENLLQCLRELVAAAQAQKRIGSAETPQTVAQAVFALYASELRSWVSADLPHLEQGLQQLRRMLRLLIAGLDSREGG